VAGEHDEEAIIASLIARLCRRYSAEQAEVEPLVRDAWARLATAPIRDYIEVLVEYDVARQLFRR
jgi:hypothetical protein